MKPDGWIVLGRVYLNEEAAKRVAWDCSPVAGESLPIKPCWTTMPSEGTPDGELHPETARSTARNAIGYARTFDGKGINWQSGEPWPHRIELAQALDWITVLGAMVLNLADRVAAPEKADKIEAESMRKVLKSRMRLR